MANEEATEEIRRQIEAMSRISGPCCGSPKFTRIKGLGRAQKERAKKHKEVRRPKNLHLLEDDSSVDKTESGSSTSSVNYRNENEILASVLAMGINYYDKKLEQRWRYDKGESTPSAAKPQVFASTRAKPLSRDNFAKNALMSSLLKKQETIIANECNGEGITCNADQRTNVGGDTSNQKFIRDAIDPDFFHRPTKVTNPMVDFTVEHVGKVTITGPRKSIIENYNDADFVFPRKNHRRLKKTRGKKKVVTKNHAAPNGNV